MSKGKPTQWHPIFAELLRPMLQDYYEVQTNVPVGDAPREADILLVRRTSNQPTPFHGLWRHLKTWNVLEFKGSARRVLAHLPLLDAPTFVSRISSLLSAHFVRQLQAGAGIIVIFGKVFLICQQSVADNGKAWR
jgi:hypothetical protein